MPATTVITRGSSMEASAQYSKPQTNTAMEKTTLKANNRLS